ncbi:hypothetical protein [Rickettsia helvetica]|uniref:Ankyrin repeat-containing protein n=1 Tax=Rickettsia helvetica TaxID=35789 RepID=A0ABP0T5H2_RICHE|nr:hypothetical protein [Rickettsia helvetica]MCZ6884563.1 hypothetical protein [Rickettsia endosymbiont of Ixodes ricinus]MCZ6896874.1 hypothetical protein [Rickettsia endosymbiont of Ixodes ricinus]
MKKHIEQYLKKQRNDIDTQVKKYKQELDAIGIKYDHKSAHVEVPNHAIGGFEYFKWDWMTSTTGSHSEIVPIFKDIVRTLKEAKSNPAQYENLVSNLDASTKNALDATIKSNNITVPIQDTNKLIAEILTGMQIWLDTKSHIPLELKQKFLELGSNNLEEFIESASNKFNNKWIVKEFINNAFIPPREESNKYLADSGCDLAEQLWTKIENLRMSENSTDASEDDEISDASANKLGDKVTLTNGAKFEVKSILKCLSDKGFMDMILKEVPYNTREPLEKEIALQFVYNNIQEGRIDKSSTVNMINSFGNASTLLSWFVEYSDLNIDEIKAKEVEITGGDSYLD